MVDAVAMELTGVMVAMAGLVEQMAATELTQQMQLPVQTPARSKSILLRQVTEQSSFVETEKKACKLRPIFALPLGAEMAVTVAMVVTVVAVLQGIGAVMQHDTQMVPMVAQVATVETVAMQVVVVMLEMAGKSLSISTWKTRIFSLLSVK
jgi:hypothetical protein